MLFPTTITTRWICSRPAILQPISFYYLSLAQLAQGQRHEQPRRGVRNMILALITIVEQPQVFLGTGEVIVDAAPDPLVIWMRGDAVAHDPGNYF